MWWMGPKTSLQYEANFRSINVSHWISKERSVFARSFVVENDIENIRSLDHNS